MVGCALQDVGPRDGLGRAVGPVGFSQVEGDTVEHTGRVFQDGALRVLEEVAAFEDGEGVVGYWLWFLGIVAIFGDARGPHCFGYLGFSLLVSCHFGSFGVSGVDV